MIHYSLAAAMAQLVLVIDFLRFDCQNFGVRGSHNLNLGLDLGFDDFCSSLPSFSALLAPDISLRLSCLRCAILPVPISLYKS